MPRNSSGVYSYPPGTIVNTGDTVLVSQHNPFVRDVAQALTNSLDRNGAGGMNANLNMSGNRVVNIANGVNDGDAVSMRQLNAASSVPIGAVIDYWGSNVPQGYMLCDGREVSRSTYPELFAAIGTNAGAGNGSTTFNLPDYRDVVSVGRGNMGGTVRGLLSNFSSTVLGALFGAQDVTLTEAQMPEHNHSINDPGHRHNITNGSVLAGGGAFPNVGGGYGSVDANVSTNTTGITINNRGGDQPHPNVQPTIVCNKIIRYN